MCFLLSPAKINVTPKVVYWPISKLHLILAVANLLAHNNITQICYCGQISLQSAAVFLTPLGVTFILLDNEGDSTFFYILNALTLILPFSS